MNQDYIKRINNVLAYIDENLATDLSLESISKIAFYSPFHLHRLFRAITNEPLNVYINRKRIEKSAILLIHNPELSISEIALQNGFNSNSSFARSFKKHYAQSPTEFRNTNLNNFSKIGKPDSKNGKVDFITEIYLCNINNLKNWITMNATIEIKTFPQMNLAYIIHIGVDGVENTFHKIMKWAIPKGLLKDGNIVRMFHDSFKITDADKVRMSVGITVNETVKVDGEVGLTNIKAGKYIVGRFEILVPEFEKSWNGLFIWMNENGYQKAEGNPFEIYHNNPSEHPENKCIVDLCIPVV